MRVRTRSGVSWEVGRIYVATGEEAAAGLAARVALTDQGMQEGAADIAIRCSVTPCYQPGAEVTVTVGANVRLPFVPDVLAGAINAQIPLIGFVMIVILAVGVVANASKAFVYRRSLASWADGAAIAAAQSIAEDVVYAPSETSMPGG